MIELLGKSVSGQIQKEIKKATAHLKGSNFEKEANGPKHESNKTKGKARGDVSGADMKHMVLLLKEKANKFDMEMSMR